MIENKDQLSRLGFKYARGGAHASRTIMLDELRDLFRFVGRPDATPDDYLKAIDIDNCLGKRSGKTRMLTYRHLVDLYSLDPNNILFRTMIYFWERDIDGQPLLAVLCAYARDSILRTTASFVLSFPEGAQVERVALEAYIDKQEPGRFSKATLKSTAQNINSTWTKTGHLEGRAKKIRHRAEATPGSVAYALLMGYLTGARGQALFQTEYMKVLDCSVDRAIELAESASGKGWIVFKRVGAVIEVLFPNLISLEELESA